MANRTEVAFLAASKVHEKWCQGELGAYFSRLVSAYNESGNVESAFESACFKKGQRRNYAKVEHSAVSEESLTPEGFNDAVSNGDIKIFRFTKRNLSREEQSIMFQSGDYIPQTREENILRPFAELSDDSQKENLDAADNALYVYEQLKRAGLDEKQMQEPNNRDYVGKIIHTAWMSRNVATEGNSYLFCPYEQLGDWEKGQDLDVFDAVVETAMETGYEVKQDRSVELPTPEQLEQRERIAIENATNTEIN